MNQWPGRADEPHHQGCDCQTLLLRGTHDELRAHLADFVTAYNFAKRLKTLKRLTPYEYICKVWTKEPERFTLNPLHQMPGLNT